MGRGGGNPNGLWLCEAAGVAFRNATLSLIPKLPLVNEWSKVAEFEATRPFGFTLLESQTGEESHVSNADAETELGCRDRDPDDWIEARAGRPRGLL